MGGYISNLRGFSEFKVSLDMVIILCFLTGFIVWGLTVYSFKVGWLSGETKVWGVGVGVYWDRNCDNPVNSISWGKIVVDPLKPEASKNITVYIKNEGYYPIVIKLNTSSWSPPSAQKYIRLSWDYDGHVLNVDEKVKVTLTLSIDSKIWFESPIIKDYSFNIIISASYHFIE